MRHKIEKITLKEFQEKYMQTKTAWDFSKFHIVCQKCQSSMVEINGEGNVESGYYGSMAFEGKIIVKCHNCGNALTKTIAEASGENSYCPHEYDEISFDV